MSRTGVFSYIDPANQLGFYEYVLTPAMEELAEDAMVEQIDELLQCDVEFLMSMPVETFVSWAQRRELGHGSC